MKNKYIKNKGYSVKYDLKSLLICFDYFNHGIKLPIFIDFIIIRKIVHYLLRLMIITAYIFKMYDFKYKIVTLEEDAHIIYKGKGEWHNVVRLIQQNGKLKIIKTTYDKESYLREKKYYQLYKNNSSGIVLPKMYFKKNNQIEIEFLKIKSFQRCINDGSMNLDNALLHFKRLENKMHLFYKNKVTLIHSDLSTENILINGDTYYFIDFADSRIDNMEYDLFVFLRSILFSFNHRNVNNKLKKYSLTSKHLSTLLKIKKEQIIKFENTFRNLDNKKHPNHKPVINQQQLSKRMNYPLLTINKLLGL